MSKQHQEIARQLRNIGEFPKVYIQQIASNGYNITVASTDFAHPGQILSATYNIQDLLAVIRNSRIEGEEDERQIKQ